MLLCIPAYLFSQPCSTTSAAGCSCPGGADTCYLLPDITISWQALRDHENGPTEYSQTGNGVENGRLRITGCTPNIGRGPFTVRGTDYFICGTDTYYSTSSNFTCPNGATPTNLLHQRIYKKMGSTMTYEDRWAGGQTYHPTHGHNHVDDWVSFTLRVQDPHEPDTLKWPVIGTGTKLGFCLMDYGACDDPDYYGYCREPQIYGGGTIKVRANTPNYGLGGGTYNCSPVEQGISVGYLDIYSESLDGMWINIPPNTCNGDYWIIAEVDPRNVFLESNESNNWTAIPFTLTQQLPAGTATADISIDGTPFICHDSGVTLTASPALGYLWSNGATTQSITVNIPGSYVVQTTSQCGTAVSDTVIIDEINSVITTVKGDTTCVAGTLALFAAGTGTVNWYETMSGGAPLFTGEAFTTPVLTNSATYYAENVSEVAGTISFLEPHDHTGTSQFSSFHGYIIFDCFSPFILRSVKVYTNDAGTRLIEWRSSSGNVLASQSVYIPAGTSRVTLNFSIIPGTNYQLGTNESVNNANFGSITPLLRRTRNGLSYPYELSGVVSLTGSPYDSQLDKFYYYFYDWEIEIGRGVCVSPRQPVNAVVLPSCTTTLSGSIITELNVPIMGVSVELAGFSRDTIVTSGNGSYTFDCTFGKSYTVTPFGRDDLTPANGITVLDMVRVKNHVLGIKPLNSPYKIIAADADGSTSVTTNDILLMKAMILGSISSFPGNKLWNFVPSDFMFANPADPFPFDTMRAYPSITGQGGQNFIGIKLGDVNNSWNPAVR